MEVSEITAGTVEQATEKAEARLGRSRDQFKVEVIREGRSGMLGVGGREAVIRVSSTTLPEEDVVSRVTEVLDTLLGLMGAQGKVEVLSDELPLALNIEGDDLGILIGRRGQTLVALEYVTKLIVVQRLKAWVPLTIDVGCYKEHRRESLMTLSLHS